ncbi:MAG: ethanolamine ammonia-lyase subunit EutC [Acidobacteriaceae bacterium]|nr:ethanolamine ammonia-lyase subunit EutC [Acidobacteriaceae bacterium]
MSDSPSRIHTPGSAWNSLRRYTKARIALPHTGASLSTQEVLNFDMAHACARDAVHVALDVDLLEQSLMASGFAAIRAQSRAITRAQYLQRPDLGRQLAPECAARLTPAEARANTLTIVIADGLSSVAVARHAVPLLTEIRRSIAGWEWDAIVIATQARVALGDQIGALRHSTAVIVLIGERPGLSSPDSLGIYMTYGPRPGLTDSDRNCISNVHPGGLPYYEAAFRLAYLLQQSQQLGKSGIEVKDLSSAQDTLPSR